MIELSQSDINKLHGKVLNEYGRAKRHTQGWKEEVKNRGRDYLLPKPGQDKIKIRKVATNLNTRLATFVSDEIQVTNIPASGVLGKDTAIKCDKVFKYNFDSMDVRTKYMEALIDDALKGVGVLAVDGWNNHKQEPILSYIDSTLTFPDPKNWKGNCMNFFGTKVRKSWYELMQDDAYDSENLQKCKMYVDSDIQDTQRAENQVVGFNEDINADENETDLYNHITVFKAEDDEKPGVYLTTWGAGITEPVRCIKMRPLTDGEIADPSTIDFGVVLFRAKPLKGSYAGISLVDDVGQYQDVETLISNLQIQQAKLASLGGKTFINTELGADEDDIANRDGAGDIIYFTSENPQINAQNGIYQEPPMPISPITSNTLQYLNSLSQQADPSGTALAQGQSVAGSQTKAEIQTLQQNINHVLSYMASNYIESLKDMWTCIYRSYAANMSPQKKKEIVVVDDSGNPESYGFKKHEFISDGEAYIVVKSKAQEDIKQKQDFAIRLSLDGSISSILAPGSFGLTKWKRSLLSDSGVKGINGEDYFPMSADERKAYSDLERLNNNIKLDSKPQLGEDHDLYIQIYKTGLDNEANAEAIKMREDAVRVDPPKQEQAPTGQGGAATQLGASMLASDNAQQTVSTGDVTA